MNKYGTIPLPPYIKKDVDDDDKIRYQTIYSKPYGSAAAPTAGLHFDEKVFSELQAKGVNHTYVTLHVGLGTFQPIYSDTIEAHQIHQEEYEISENEARELNEALSSGKILLPVGTTSLRTIESNFDNGSFKSGQVVEFSVKSGNYGSNNDGRSHNKYIICHAETLFVI